MHRTPISILALLAVLTPLGPAAAAPSPSSAAAAADATRAARAVLYNLEHRNGSRLGGTVTLQVIGRTRTRVNVQLANPAGHPLSLAIIKGSDCIDNRESALASTIPLNPVNSSRLSSTIVSVPLNQLTSKNYLVQIRDATARQQITEACARLAR
jgi:hypothetical protein